MWWARSMAAASFLIPSGAVCSFGTLARLNVGTSEDRDVPQMHPGCKERI